MNDPLLAVLDRSRALGFLGPGPVEDHLHHALAFARAVATPPARALDLGAGGGLPGLVLASRIWPGTSWTFLDAQQKRTEFLREVVTDLGLDDRVAVITERAEVLGRSPDHRGVYDLVVSRSFGPPAVTAECGAPLLRPGGRLFCEMGLGQGKQLRRLFDRVGAYSAVSFACDEAGNERVAMASVSS